jgi:hypothetical protein
MSESITVTLVDTASGSSESLPVTGSTTVQELSEWSKGLFGLSGDIHLYKDGTRLAPSASLQQAGVQHGDLVAAQVPRAAVAPPVAAPASGGLDFSSLLQQQGGPAAPNVAGVSTQPPDPVYYPGMHLNDASKSILIAMGPRRSNNTSQIPRNLLTVNFISFSLSLSHSFSDSGLQSPSTRVCLARFDKGAPNEGAQLS